MADIIGQPIDRKDGKLKVTGTATYAAEFQVDNIAYGFTLQSSISKGHIENIDVSAAKALKGVLEVMTYKNAPGLHQLSSNDPGSGKFSEKDLLPLQSERIFYNGQHIAVVIAESLEVAEQAASVITVTYQRQDPVVELGQAGAELYLPGQGLGGTQVQKQRGDTAKAMEAAPVKIEETYRTPVYHHNPIEPHATTA